MLEKIVENLINDVRINLDDEFDQNFERKAFFDQPWAPTKMANNRGSLMMRSGNLRNSLQSAVTGEEIRWTSSLPYASIHNEGGDITVTQNMKAFFWAMYYNSSGAVKGVSQRDVRLSAEAQQWKNMALMKVGQTMKIEQRQFIGDHPMVDKHIEIAFQATLTEVDEELMKRFKQR